MDGLRSRFSNVPGVVCGAELNGVNAVCEGGITVRTQPVLSVFTSKEAIPESASEAAAETKAWEVYQPFVPFEALMLPSICGVVTSSWKVVEPLADKPVAESAL